MNTKQVWRIIHVSTVIFVMTLATNWRCGSSRHVATLYPIDTIVTNKDINGTTIHVHATRGKHHNHPLMAIWLTDSNNAYIETLYVAESIAKGQFEYSDKSDGAWKSGPLRRPAALPVWSHSRGIQEKDGLYNPTPETAMPDAVTGATPNNSFVISSKSSVRSIAYVYFEVNQTWDWNEYWTNDRYPDDEEYKTSCQPSLIYRATIDISNKKVIQDFQIIGHGHYNGSTGRIFTDVSTISTAKEIVTTVKVTLE